MSALDDVLMYGYPDDDCDDWGREGPPSRFYDCKVVESTARGLCVYVPEYDTEYWVSKERIYALNRGPDGIINTLEKVGDVGMLYVPSWMCRDWMANRQVATGLKRMPIKKKDPT